MLGQLWLVITVVTIIISLIMRQPPLLIVAFLFFLAGGVARLWDKYSLRRVEYQRHLSAERVFFGEIIDLEVEITNRKPLPLPWLQIDDEIPANVKLLKGKTDQSHMRTNVVLNNLFSLSWYHRVKRHYPIECHQRGYFTFGPANIRSGDIFGFFIREMKVQTLQYLIVYPKIVPLEKLILPSNQPLGDIRIKTSLFRDPILSLGVREYHYGDSLKNIHWKSTARTGELQTKIFEATTTIDVAIFLDVRTIPPPHWGSSPEKLELAIITATAVANEGLFNGFRVGLYVNQHQRDRGYLIRLPPSQNPGQFKHILESLAGVQELEAIPIARLLSNESRNIPWGSAIVLITATPTDELLNMLFKIKRSGRKISLIQVGGQPIAYRRTGISYFQVPQGLSWRDIQEIKTVAK